jgi:hypothetical protein
MAPRVRVLLDFLAERFTRVTGELEAQLGLPPQGGARKTLARTRKPPAGTETGA